MKFISKITTSQLFKITSLNSISVLLKIGIGLITSKILALFVGPSGMALVGNLKNFTTSLESISTMGFQNGIVKYVAENKEEKAKINSIFSTVFSTLLLVSVVLSCVLFFFASYWNLQIFGVQFDFTIVFRCLALLLPWYASSLFLLSFINGLGQYKNVIYINIIGNIIGLLVSVLMIVKWQTLGALLSIVVTPSLLFFVTYYSISKEINLFKSINFKSIDFNIIRYLSSFSLMALVSSVVGPIVFLAIRNYVIHKVGLEEAGYWETISRISSYYLLFVTTIITIYFLPKLAMAKTNEATKSIFWSFYKYQLPLFIIGVVIIYFLRFFIINTLFTKAFLPVTALFFWQMIGDILKVASWILAFNLLAKKMTLAFIVTELFSLIVTYFFSLYFVNQYGIEGIVMAHAMTYLIYLIVLGIYFRKSLF